MIIRKNKKKVRTEEATAEQVNAKPDFEKNKKIQDALFRLFRS